MKTIEINPKQLSGIEKEQFCDDLYQIQSQIFNGVKKDDFLNYTIFSKAQQTRIKVLLNPEGKYVGYFALHYFELTYEGEQITIIRGETGLLPAYRSGGSIKKWGQREMLRYKIRNRKRKTYILACFVTPITYYLMAKAAYEVYPNPINAMPKHIHELMTHLSEKFEMRQVVGQNEFVKHVGWQVKESDNDHQKIMHASAIQFKFFLNENPNYLMGYGLQSLYPMSQKNILITLLNQFLLRAHPKLKIRKKLPSTKRQHTAPNDL